MTAKTGNAVQRDEVSSGAPHPFFSLLQMTTGNEVELSPQQAVATASLIVSGTIESIVDGRIIDFKQGRSNPIQTAVLKVRVDNVVKAATSPGEFVYVEYIRGGIDPGQLNRTKYTEPMIWLLQEANGWDPNVYRFDNPGKGVGTGAVLYTLRTQRGLFAQSGPTVHAPLAPHDPPIIKADSIPAAEAQLRQLAN
jgi:hypothetical protein